MTEEELKRFTYYLAVAINLLNGKVEAIEMLKNAGYLDPRDVLRELETKLMTELVG